MSVEGPRRFRATIYRLGILRCVDVPREMSVDFAGWRHPPVRVRVGGQESASHLVPGGSGRFRLFLDGDLRSAAAVDEGESVEIEIRLDPTIDDERFPDELLDLAESVPGGPVVLETLPPGLKGEILRFLADAKSPATRRKRMARIEELLRERAVKQGLGG